MAVAVVAVAATIVIFDPTVRRRRPPLGPLTATAVPPLLAVIAVLEAEPAAAHDPVQGLEISGAAETESKETALYVATDGERAETAQVVAGVLLTVLALGLVARIAVTVRAARPTTAPRSEPKGPDIAIA